MIAFSTIQERSMPAKSDSVRVLFVIQGIDVDMSRRRVLQYLPVFEAKGIACEVLEKPKSFFKRLSQYRRFGGFDVVVVQRYRYQPWDLAVVRRAARSLVYDFDDAVMFPNSLSKKRTSRSRQARFRRMVGAMDCVFAGNTFLEEKAKAYCDWVEVIPTSLDRDQYTVRSWPDADPPTLTIGWIGAPTSLHYLEKLRPVWDKVYDANPNVRLKIVSRRFFDCERMPVEKKYWQLEEEVQDLQSFDIGVMPLTVDTWSEGKCALKILQCHAVGVPAVCTPVGMNKEVVVEGETGLLAGTAEEWVEKITTLVRDREARIRMGVEGRRRLETTYSLQAVAPRMIEAFRRLGGKGRRVGWGVS
jgi:glycosyltransferase involved in cell wall biosynthesis